MGERNHRLAVEFPLKGSALNEASLVDLAAYHGAEIVSIVSKRTAKASPAAGVTSTLPAAGEQVIYGGGLLRRPAIGQVLGVR